MLKSFSHLRYSSNSKMSVHPDLELKEMKTVIENRTQFVCKPCKFESESLAKSTKHVYEDEKHKKLAANYCHACDKSFPVKAILENHRISIDHQKKVHGKLSKIYKISVHPDQELKEMKTVIENKTKFVCKPCNFDSESLTESTEHVYENEEHKKLVANYCHACEKYFPAKGIFEDHRFSIVHQKKLSAKLSGSDTKKKGRMKRKSKRLQSTKDSKKSSKIEEK